MLGAVSTLHQEASLLDKIRTKEAVVGVIGLGYVGLPFAVEAAKAGFPVIGVDQNQDRCDQVNGARNYIRDVDDTELKELVEGGKLVATHDFSRVPEMDVIVIAVPTPLTKNLTPDLTYVLGVTDELSRHLRAGQLVSLESTTYPGTTEGEMLPILERSGLKVEEDFYLVHSPERVDPGNIKYTTKNTHKVLGPVGPRSLEVAKAFYETTLDHIVVVSSASAAELVKVWENTFRAYNIAAVNELAMICDQLRLNVWEVVDAANSKPFGIMPFYPGPGVGGHCIPLDPHYLEHKAKELGITTEFIALAGKVNRNMPHFVVDKAARLLSDRAAKAVNGAKVLILGVAYKGDIDDDRESPALEVFRLFHERSAVLQYHDPFIPKTMIGDTLFESVELTDELFQSMDLVVITTNHSTVDYQGLIGQARLVLDTRGHTRTLGSFDNVVLL
ncbi:MAG: nucleotide sugar dehydrogenase [Candidatus Berkelbacteria bacterium]|nr:MAG: nucleotide sugar dehydrogenase [Candidatus Berkelbacteria bacterium]QQG51684.1 MAG: nucleotide sugar dehydrogenase [Candidatus Berkelbacteria bacterium]